MKRHENVIIFENYIKTLTEQPVLSNPGEYGHKSPKPVVIEHK